MFCDFDFFKGLNFDANDFAVDVDLGDDSDCECEFSPFVCLILTFYHQVW